MIYETKGVKQILSIWKNLLPKELNENLSAQMPIECFLLLMVLTPYKDP